MKFVFMALISTALLSGFSAHAFITPQEQGRLIAKLNEGNFGQVHFEDVRCSLRSRLCIVKLSVGPEALPAGCMIERISDSAEILTESVNADGSVQTVISPYAEETLVACVRGLSN